MKHEYLIMLLDLQNEIVLFLILWVTLIWFLLWLTLLEEWYEKMQAKIDYFESNSCVTRPTGWVS